MTETISEPIISSNLEQAIADYAKALSLIEEATANPSKQQILKILLARDGVAQALPEKTQVSEDSIARLIELDGKLKSQGKAIATHGALSEWRESLHPSESSWWWFFQPPKIIDKRDRFDWLWDTLTTATLVLSSSFMIHTFQSFSVGGLGILEVFSTIAQGAGIALIGNGALTSDGKKKVQATLHRLNIPPYFYSEVIFGFSTLLLLGTYGLHSSLPHYWSQRYYKIGKEFYRQGNVKSAEYEYLKAINLDPDNANTRTDLGLLYESIDETDQAIIQYKHAWESNDFQALNNMGRIYIIKGDFVTAESLLRLGLQYVSNHQPNLQYKLYRNLGWALLQQKKYPEAEQELNKAIEIDKRFPNPEDKLPGAGMANCFLAKTRESEGKKELAKKEWVYCQKFAKPEIFAEYKWFIEVGERDIAQYIDTSKIIQNPRLKPNLGEMNKLPPQVKETP